jgi:hypothetical protein
VFLDIDQFCHVLLARRPSLAGIRWASHSAKQSFLLRIGPSLRRHRSDTVLSRLAGGSLDSESFERELLRALAMRHPSRRCLLVDQIEPLAPAAGAVLNGYREKLAALRAAVLMIRDDRYRDFAMACPDLMDWVGPNIARAEDLGPPFTLADIVASIRILEKRHGMRSAKFQQKWSGGKLEGNEEYSLWNELIAMQEGLREPGMT